MPGAFGHLVGAWIFGLLFTRFRKTSLNRVQWASLLFGGILPDIDFLVDWTTCIKIHRTITHSFLGSVMFALLFLFLLLCYKKFFNRKINICLPAILLLIGINLHIFLDLTTDSSGLQIFWPFQRAWVTLAGQLQHNGYPPTYAQLKSNLNQTIFDMGLGVSWLMYLYLRKRLSFS